MKPGQAVLRIDSDGGFAEATWTQENDRWTIESRQVLPDGGLAYSVNLLTRIDDNSRPCAVYAHRLGTPQHEDRLVFTEHDPAFHVDVWKSRSRRFIFIQTANNNTTEIHTIDTAGTQLLSRCFAPRRRGIEYYVDHQGQRFLILSNERASNFCLYACPVGSTDTDALKTVLPERETVTLEYVEPYAKFIVVGELQGGIEHIRILGNSGEDHYVELPDPLYSVEVEDLEDYASELIRIDYSSPVNPAQVLDYQVTERALTQRKVDRVRDYDPKRFVCERLSVPSSSGVAVPLSVVRPRNRNADGPAPVLLLGYGAYGESLDLGFDADLVSLLQRGVVVALAHVRGGGELGPVWHHAGRLLNKENSFSDFLDCARYLIEIGYSAPGRIAIAGASAGGWWASPRSICANME